MQAEPCTDWGTTSFLIGTITGMIASWAVMIYVSIIRKEDR